MPVLVVVLFALGVGGGLRGAAEGLTFLGAMKPVTLAAFNGREEAEPLRQYLGAAGIRAEIRSDGDLGPVEFERPSAGVRLEVAREDFEDALRLVYEWNVAGSALPGLGEGAPSWMRPKRGTAGGGAKAPAGG